jgi:hypothetical protein
VIQSGRSTTSHVDTSIPVVHGNGDIHGADDSPLKSSTWARNLQREASEDSVLVLGWRVVESVGLESFFL